MKSTTERGLAAEEQAAILLQTQGYEILARNVRTPEGELDIIAREGAVVVFVEVKARQSYRFGSALAAVDRKKRQRIRQSAANYMQFFPQGASTMIRFDVVTIEAGVARVLRNAF